jgi:branched-chain amino acid transport system ATP-binding protein
MNGLLNLDQITTYYGQMRILEGISIEVGAGELVCLLGGNASGKSTTLKTILGLVRPRAGKVMLAGEDVTGWPVPQRIANGIAIVPENRRLFGDMTVRENLELGATLCDPSNFASDLERVHTLFPRLHERKDQLAGTLSGGEQQATAIARALMSNPRLLLLDEVSLGLAPLAVEAVYDSLRTVIAEGATVLLVEQDLARALAVASRVICLLEGRIALEGPAASLTRDQVTEAYFGLRDRAVRSS